MRKKRKEPAGDLVKEGEREKREQGKQERRKLAEVEEGGGEKGRGKDRRKEEELGPTVGRRGGQLRVAGLPRRKKKKRQGRTD